MHARRLAMAFAGTLLLGGCIWEEPITPQPIAQDSAVTIIHQDPDTGVVNFQHNPPGTGPCEVFVQLPEVYSPQGQQLSAEVFLNYQSFSQPLTIAQHTKILLTQLAGQSNLYQLSLHLPLLSYPQSLLPASASGQTNVLTVFVSDGFPPDQPTQPSGSAFSTDQRSWQILLTDLDCASKLADVIP